VVDPSPDVDTGHPQSMVPGRMQPNLHHGLPAHSSGRRPHGTCLAFPALQRL